MRKYKKAVLYLSMAEEGFILWNRVTGFKKYLGKDINEARKWADKLVGAGNWREVGLFEALLDSRRKKPNYK